MKNSPEIHCEANLLDLKDVEYADASEDEDEVDDRVIIKEDAPEVDAMTPAEAENLLSSKYARVFTHHQRKLVINVLIFTVY